MAVNVLLPLLIPLGEQITNGTGNLYFSRSTYEVHVEESVAPVLLVTLQARSNTTSGAIYYKIVGGDEGGKFSANSRTGVVTLNAPLDYEAQHYYEVFVGAVVGQEKAFSRILVKVDDVNDQAPSFARPLYETQMTEEDDRHLPKKILQPLDRDAPNGRAKWVLVVGVTDGLHDALTTLHVNVKDINDNAPFFTSEIIHGSVEENSPAGSEVVTVEAIDLDDPNEGTHAKLSYSLEKNVIDEVSGRPIFTINQSTGRITTALCCLDREKTASYAIQVVATDGGGLKGTGSVVVTIADVNDSPPQFSVSEWRLFIRETSELNSSLAQISVQDPDLKNNFSFTVVPYSGYGWDKFRVLPSPPDGGSLVAVQPLDYEDLVQRNGFRFKIQVIDKDIENTKERLETHSDNLQVVITLVDDNDNDPKLLRTQANLTLPEDTSTGTLLAQFSATDADNGGESKIFYTIDLASDSGRRFLVDSEGRVTLRRPFDREDMSHHSVTVLAIDEGVPARTATATVFITVTDVNDNPPFIKTPTSIVLLENVEPSRIANLTMDDLDDWELGNGPPFHISLDESASIDIKQTFSVEYNAEGDRGRGSGILTSLKAMDREKGALRPLPLILKDMKGQSTTVTLTVTLADVNDNPMMPGTKTVDVTRIKHHQYKIPLGRVFVDDPDDWDSGDKIWKWYNDSPQPFFSLDQNSGKLSASPEIKDDTYYLRFLVSDETHKQKNVPANVTVKIHTLDVGSVVSPAVPILVASHTPEELITNQNTDISPLESLLKSASSILHFKIRVLALEEREASSLRNKNLNLIYHRGDNILKDNFAQSFTVTKDENFELGTRHELKNSNSSGYMKNTDVPPSGIYKESFIQGDKALDDGEKYQSIKFAYIKDEVGLILKKTYVPLARNLSLSKPPKKRFALKNSYSSRDGRRSSFSTTLWVTSNTRRPLDQLLLINRAKISKLSGVKIGDVGVGICARFDFDTEKFPVHLRHRISPTKSEVSYQHSSVSAKAAADKMSWVIDANTTALVTPKIWAGVGCSCRRDQTSRNNHKNFPSAHSQPLQVRHSNSVVPSCYPDPCLNGGRCVSSTTGPKCICPENTHGPVCKQLSRHFGEGGWAWVEPIPSCSYAHISLEFLTQTQSCLLFYTGPGPDHPQGPNGQHPLLQGDVLSLELFNGLPKLLIDIGTNPVVLMPKVSYPNRPNNQPNRYKGEEKEESLLSGNLREKLTENSRDASHLADGEWHRLDVIWGGENVELLIDLCQSSFENCHIKAHLPLNGDGFHSQIHFNQTRRNLAPRTPLQLGGLAYPPPSPSERGWSHSISQSSLNGCIRNLRVNGRLYDLGKDLLANRSIAGCNGGNFCKSRGENCPRNSKCVGTHQSPSCECLPGWTGKLCDQNTIPASFGKESYIRVALSFLPANSSTNIQLRFRTWSSVGQLILITSQHSRDQLSLFLEDGRLCLLLALRFLSSKSWSSKKHVCLAKVTLNDGQWHTVYARRYGKWTELWVDSGEWPLYNASLTVSVRHRNEKSAQLESEALLSDFNLSERPKWGSEPLIVDRQEGVHIGGVPEYSGVSLLIVRHDFVHGCIDDVRLGGRSLPLPPNQNTSKWAQATTYGSSVTSFCPGTPVCENVTCPHPLICVDLWRKHHCGCMEGKVLTSDSSSCHDVDECIWKPCLNEGTCFNSDPGYSCTCPTEYLGENCQYEGVTQSNASFSVGVIIGAVSWALFLLLIIAAFIIHHKCGKKRKRRTRGIESPISGVAKTLEQRDPQNSAIICPHSKMMELKVLQETCVSDRETDWLDTSEDLPEMDVLRVGLLPEAESDHNTASSRLSFKRPHTVSSSCEGQRSDEQQRSFPRNSKFDNGREDSVAVKIVDGGRKEKIKAKVKNVGCGGCEHILAHCDDLRNYAYEGDGSSPVSLSSCCSGNSSTKGAEKFIGGFQEVSTLLSCLNNELSSSKKLSTNQINGSKIRNKGATGDTHLKTKTKEREKPSTFS